MKRGVLSASNAIASPTFQQSWALDARGNQVSTTTNGSTTTRQFNRANETTSVSGGAAPAYDDAGNTKAKDGRTYFYDAWNRLKRVEGAGSTVVASYSYDALRRRTVEASGGTTTAVYFSGSTPIEERIGTFGYQNVIGVTGQVAFRDVYGDITDLVVGATADWRTYAQQDANGDVVALVGNGTSFAGIVRERYAYSPYGVASILDASGSPASSSSFAWRQLFQGGRLDAATGLYVFGFRDYDPAAGVWTQRDPIGLAGGDSNLYRFVGNNPVNFIDPSGLSDDSWTDWAYDYYSGVADAVYTSIGGAAAFVDGAVAGAIDGLLEPFVGPIPFEPINAFTNAWDHGRAFGKTTAVFGEAASSAAGIVTAVTGTFGGPGTLLVVGGGAVTLPVGIPVVLGGLGVAGLGYYMACSNLSGPTPTDRYKEQLFEREKQPRSKSTVRGASDELAGRETEAAIQRGRTYDHVTKTRNAQRGLVTRIQQIKRKLGDSSLSEAQRASLQAELSEASRLLDLTSDYVPRVR